MVLTITEIYIAMMVLARLVGLFTLVPLFSTKRIPQVIRMGLALLITVMIYPFLGQELVMPGHPIGIGIMFFKELMVGLMMGMMVRILFGTAEFAGQIIATEMGLSMASSFDPHSGQQATVISLVLFYLVALVFFITGLQYDLILAFLRSFELIPIHSTFFVFGGVESLVRESVKLFKFGVQMAAPIIAINFIVTLSFTALGKAAPKLNVFMLSFSARIIAGLILFLLTSGLIIQYIYQQSDNLGEKMLEFLRI